MRYKTVGKLCIQCGHERPLARYTRDHKRCDYCVTGQFRDTDAIRAARRYARSKALRAMPYTVLCDKCKRDRPASYYPWITDTARKGPVCNSCLRRRVGRRGPSVPEHAPQSPADKRQSAIAQRVIERGQARLTELARVQAQGKRCADCWHVKPASDYRTETRRRDGLGASCTACESAYRVLHKTGQWLTARTALRAMPEAQK